MRRSLALLILALPLAACASTDAPSDDAARAASVDADPSAKLEVRYYVIADT